MKVLTSLHFWALIVHLVTPQDLDWGNLFNANTVRLKNPLSIPPSTLCLPSLDEHNLIKTYNSALLTGLLLKKIQFTEIPEAVFLNLSQTIYIANAQTLPLAEELCKKTGNPYKLVGKDVAFVAAVLKTALASNVLKKIMFKIKCDGTSGVTEDGFKLAAKGSCSEDHKYMVYESTGLQLASATYTIPTILCQRESPELSVNLDSLKSALEKEFVLVDAQTSTVRAKIQETFEKYVNTSILKFSENQTGILANIPPTHEKTCLDVKVLFGNPLTNFSLPTLVTPKNIIPSSELLKSRIIECKMLLAHLLKNLDLILDPETSQNPIKIQYWIQSFSDIFRILPIHAPEKMLLIILLTILVIVLVSCICFHAGYNKIVKSGTAELIRRGFVQTNNFQVVPPASNTVPLMQMHQR